MRWEKLGHIFNVDGSFPWALTHAANPVARKIGDSRIEVFFSTRAADQRSSIAMIELDLSDLSKKPIMKTEPILGPGDIGCFDDSGTSMGCFTTIEGTTHLFFLGWNLGVTVPWRNAIGCAKEQPDGRFKRISTAPVLDRHHFDPYSVSYPWIVEEQGTYHIWYGSNLAWGTSQSDMAHLIKQGHSANGIDWIREGHVSLRFKDKTEYAMSKPCVIKDTDLWRMWYSYRGTSYTIGYAESEDGQQWTRRDETAGIAPSPSGWDSEMICYPCVFDVQGERYMLYNGNGYGKTGFWPRCFEKQLMRVVVTQSNYLPWRGFFLNLVDCDQLILLDDAQYTRRDWRNRNRIKGPSGTSWITVPVSKHTYGATRISGITVRDKDWTQSHLGKIQSYYQGSPYFEEVFPLLQTWFSTLAGELHLSKINRTLIDHICSHINLTPDISWSFDHLSLAALDQLPPSDRIAKLCAAVGADSYLSGPAAKSYLDPRPFKANGIKVLWSDYKLLEPYNQHHGSYDAGVSIVDTLMNCGHAALPEHHPGLEAYDDT